MYRNQKYPIKRITPVKSGRRIYDSTVISSKTPIPGNKTIKANSRIFQTISHNITDVIWIYNLENHKYTYISPSVYQLRGYTVDEAKNQSISESLHEEDYMFIMNNLSNRIEQFKAGNDQFKTLFNVMRQPCKNGDYVKVELATTLVKNDQEKVTEIIGVSRNISHRAEDLPTLKTSQGFFETAFDFSSTGIALIKEAGEIINANMGFCNMVGYPKPYVLKKSLYHFIVEGDESCIDEIFSAARKEKNFEKQSEIRLKKIDGEVTWGLITITGIKSYHEHDLIWIIQIQDTTERKKSEEIIKLLNNDLKLKNHEMEQLIYITSHDLRSPLVNIRGFNKELENSFQELKNLVPQLKLDETTAKKMGAIEHDIKESFEYIGLSIQKMDRLLSGLLKYSRLGKQMGHPTHLVMNDIIDNIIKTHDYVIKKQKIIIETQDLPDCYASEEMINQAFSNLLENAIKYKKPEQEGLIRITGWTENKSSMYCIEDNGIGIHPNHFEKIFELFVRLQPDKVKGEGLGLSTVKKILELNGGNIHLESSPDVGSKFFVSLPATKKAERTL